MRLLAHGELDFRFVNCDALSTMGGLLKKKAYRKHPPSFSNLAIDSGTYPSIKFFRVVPAIVEVDCPYSPDKGNTDDRRTWTLEDFRSFFAQLKLVQSLSNYVILAFVDPLYTSTLFVQAAKEAFGNVEFDNFVWHRTNASNEGGNRFTSSVEVMIIVYVGGHHGAASWNRAVFSAGSQGRHNVVDLPEVPLNAKYRERNVDEPLNTMEKPVALYWYFLALLGREKSNVLSVCSGSGSMAIAAMIYGCACDSVDVSEKQWSGAVTRFKQIQAMGSEDKWSRLIADAVTLLEALKYTRSWRAAQGVKEWIARTTEVRRKVVATLLNDSTRKTYECAQCEGSFTAGNQVICCANEKCNKPMHNTCKKFKVNLLVVCCSACGQAVLAKSEAEDKKKLAIEEGGSSAAAPSPAAPASSSDAAP